MAELRRINRGAVDCIAYDRRSRQYKKYGSPWVAGHAIGKLASRIFAAQRKDCRAGKAIENPADKYDAFHQFGKFSRLREKCGQHSERNYSGSRRVKLRMNFRQLLKK